MKLHTTTELSGTDRRTGETVIVPVGTRISDVCEAGRGPCLDPDWKPTRFMALAHMGGREVRVALNTSDFELRTVGEAAANDARANG